MANPLFRELNKTELQEDLGYYKTRYSVLVPDKEFGLNLISPDRHDIGDGYYVDILDQLKKDKMLNPDQEKAIRKFLHQEQKMELTR